VLHVLDVTGHATGEVQDLAELAVVVRRAVWLLTTDVHDPLDALLRALQGLLSGRGVLSRDLLAQQRRQVVRDRERQGEPALDGGGEQGVSTQAVRAVVHPGRLTGAEEPWDGGHLVEVGPQST